jgi:hypothetical protein
MLTAEQLRPYVGQRVRVTLADPIEQLPDRWVLHRIYEHRGGGHGIFVGSASGRRGCSAWLEGVAAVEVRGPNGRYAPLVAP